jgi:hypothetical protein
MAFFRLLSDKLFRRKKLDKRKNDASIYPMY